MALRAASYGSAGGGGGAGAAGAAGAAEAFARERVVGGITPSR